MSKLCGADKMETFDNVQFLYFRDVEKKWRIDHRLHMYLNSCRIDFFLGNINIYLYSLSFLNNEVALLVSIRYSPWKTKAVNNMFADGETKNQCIQSVKKCTNYRVVSEKSLIHGTI